MPESVTLVTGGSGFVGAHLVRALVERETRVRCLVRPGTDPQNLAGLPVEQTKGDLLDRESLTRALRGAGCLFHCAADYRLWVPDSERMAEVNIEGTRNLLELAASMGVRRIVHVSTVGTLAHPHRGVAADERVPLCDSPRLGVYKRTKLRAEQVAQELARYGAPIVIANPSTPIGALDRKPTPTGQMIIDFLNRRFAAYVDTGLNVVDVRDVARGLLLVAEHGRTGERYILGGSNLSLRSIFALLARLVGRPAPRVRLPHFVPLGFAWLSSLSARLLRHSPSVPLDAARMAREPMYFASDKAARELGYTAGPVEPAFEEAVRWFRDGGYLRRGV